MYGCERMLTIDSLIIKPQLGIGGITPRPRKLMPDSERMADGMPSVVATTIGAMRVRQQVAEHDPAAAGPKRLRRRREILRLERERVGADDAGDGQPADQAEANVDADQPAGGLVDFRQVLPECRPGCRSGCRAGRS